MINKLTKRQTEQLYEYRDTWIQHGLSTDPIDREECERVVTALYAARNYKKPKFYFVDSPIAAIDKARELGVKNVDCSHFFFGQHESGIAAFYSYFLDVLDVKDIEEVRPAIEVIKSIGWALFYDEAAIITQRPAEIHLDDANPPRLHNLDGPAFRYPDDKIKIFMVHGVQVPEYVIMDPQQITVEDIEKETNAEVRRVKIDQYGQARFITDSGAVVINEDDFGTLFQKDIPNDEPLMMVRVVNSSPEPDGTFKDYFIRVDPNAYGGLKTARAAVASTWRNPDGSMMFEDPNDYVDGLQQET